MKIKEKGKMFVKGISMEDISVKLCWEVVQQFTSEGPMNCFGGLSNRFVLEGCPINFTETR